MYTVLGVGVRGREHRLAGACDPECDPRVVRVIVLFGPGNPARARAVNAPNTFSPLGGVVLTINGTSVMVWPPLSSSVCAIVLAGSPAALPFSGQIWPVRAMPPVIDPGVALVGGAVTGGP
jgi:hypothetical protein